MKNKKLILGLSTLLAVSGLAMSCGKRDNKTPEEKVEEVLGSLIYDGLDACTTDITLIYEIPDVKGVEITYAASNSKDSLEASNWLKISDDKKKALVTRPAKGSTEKGYQLAFLHANVKCENVEDKTVFPVKIMESGDTKTIGEVLQITSENKDNPVVTKGYVVAVGDGCCFIADKTGSILVYSSDAVKDVAVGDSVQVEGSLSFYQGVPQFAYSAAVKASLTKLEESIDFTPTAATVWDGAKVSEYMGYKTVDKLLGNHVTVTGTLTIESSKYYNLAIPGVTAGDGASICYPSATMKEQLAALDGKAIKVTGYTLYISHERMYIIAESIEEATISDDDKFEAAVGAVKVDSEVYTSIELASTGLYDSTITWASDNAAITIGADGHTATVTQGATDVTVKLTATITMGSKSTTKEFTVVVKASVSFDHAGTEADPYSVKDAIQRAKMAGETATTEKYYIKGVVKSVNTSGVASFGNINIDMIDEGNEKDVFIAFQVYYQNKKFTAETAALVTEGATVVVYGAVMNYKGNTPETAGKGAASVMSVTAGAPVAATGVKANESLEVKVGKTVKINATVEPSNATDKALTYTSEDTKTATVSDTGVVTGVAVGSTKVIVSLTSNSTIKAEVAINVVEAGEDPIPSGTATYVFTDAKCGSNGQATKLATADAALALFKTDSDIKPTSVSDLENIYAGVNGGYQDTAFTVDEVLKIGASKKAGKITLNFDESVKITKVEVSFAGWKAASSLSVNGDAKTSSTTFAKDCTYTAVTYELSEATNVLTFLSGRTDSSANLAVVVSSITITIA